jgi:hypothetical protein
MILTCSVCNTTFEKQRELIQHVKKIHAEFDSYESYIIHFCYGGEHPTCKCGCGTFLKFESHNNPKFYSDYTKNHWPKSQHSQETKEKIRTALINTMNEKYGVENPMQVPEFVEKIAKTKQEKYGDSTYNNLEKAQNTNLSKYGVKFVQQNQEIQQKSANTNFSKYGASSFTATPAGKEAVKKTKREKYGDETYCNVEQNRKTKLSRFGYECEFSQQSWRRQFNTKDSSTEKKLRDVLGVEKFIFSGYEFDAKYDKFIIEVDGNIYHPKHLNSMTIIQLNSVQNDFKKTKLLNTSSYELLRIESTFVKKSSNLTFEDVWINSFEQDFSFNYYTKFVAKEYLMRYLQDHGQDGLSKYSDVFLKFIRTFQPEFPTIESRETLDDVVRQIQKYKFQKVSENTFNNNTSVVGVSYLKSKFNSYWKSSYKNRISPVEAWSSDDYMKRIIKYRIGLNTSGEVFDFSLHQLIRGISALRISVSFFKPILAAQIYKHFLGDVLEPVVFDPCCGFGGRLLGFKSVYPDGIYIGCEPNYETYIELVELSKNFTNVYLYNCKIEDFDIDTLPSNLNLTFTSIPYYDIETYSQICEYPNFDDWKNTFIGKLLDIPKLIVNIPMSLEEHFPTSENRYSLRSNTSHFNQTEQYKDELLLTFNFK